LKQSLRALGGKRQRKHVQASSPPSTPRFKVARSVLLMAARIARKLQAASAELRKPPNQARGKATFNAILAEDGFEAVNTDRVAEVAGVGICSLYQCFPNEGSLVGAFAVRHTEAMAAVIAGGVQAAADDNLPNLVKAPIRSTMQAHAANPKLRRAIIEEFARIGRPARIAEFKRGIHQSVVALLTARRSRIKVKDIPMAALVIIIQSKSLVCGADRGPRCVRPRAAGARAQRSGSGVSRGAGHLARTDFSNRDSRARTGWRRS